MKKLPKWLPLVILLSLLIFGGGFEIFYRFKIVSSSELKEAQIWIKRCDSVKSAIGEITEVKLRRTSTSYFFGTDGTHGRFHLLLTGNKGNLDVLMTWHKRPSDSSIVIEKVESLESMQRQLIGSQQCGRGDLRPK